jgi:hypothetical protein
MKYSQESVMITYTETHSNRVSRRSEEVFLLNARIRNKVGNITSRKIEVVG